MRGIRALLKKAVEQALPFEMVRRIKHIGLKNAILYFFFQRILCVNSHVPWPVHWSSIVSSPERIERKYWRPYPGYMPGQYIQAINGIIIGENVRFGPAVKLISANHNLNDFSRHDHADPIIIGDNCWISANAVILPGVKLGNHVVVAAGAVVTKSFPDNCLIGGVPAKIIKELEAYQGKLVW